MHRILLDSSDATRRRVLTHETLGTVQDFIHVDRKQGWILVRDGDTQIKIFNFLTEKLEFALAVEPDAQISCNSDYVITHCCIPEGTALIMFSKIKKTA